MTELLILADANSFFASCERVFNPSLNGRPVVVLSNNDGCVVSRSAEAKRLGIRNGTAWFKIRERARQDGVIACSSNYELYASLSHRMMSVMRRFFPHQEIYSIDECFLHAPLTDVSRTMETCIRMRRAVLEGVGIPVSIGIATSKTLAKIANHWAKEHIASNGTTYWPAVESEEGDSALASIPIEHIWGVGRHNTRKLQALGILNALQLRQTDPTMIRHRFSILLERTVLELRGLSCIEEEPDANDGIRTSQIVCSRMFSQPIQEFCDMSQALNVYAQKACHRLRIQHSVCSRVCAFCASSPFDDDGSYISQRGTVILDNPSDNPLTIARAARDALREQYDDHCKYIRAGIVLLDLQDARSFHTLEGLEADIDTRGLGNVLDEASRRFGSAHVGIGFGGIRGTGRADSDTGARWTMRRDMLSKRCTTRWDEMAVVHAR